jgi:hypothetical protein
MSKGLGRLQRRILAVMRDGKYYSVPELVAAIHESGAHSFGGNEKPRRMGDRGFWIRLGLNERLLRPRPPIGWLPRGSILKSCHLW